MKIEGCTFRANVDGPRCWISDGKLYVDTPPDPSIFKRPKICWPWTNNALRLIAVSNAFHECRSRDRIGAGLFRLLRRMSS